MVGVLTALAPMAALPVPAQAAPYRFTKVADSLRDGFHPFSFGCSSINTRGDVAFRAELDQEFSFDEGLFPGRGDAVTTHYLAPTSRFAGDDSRPSINNLGDIAFQEQDDATFDGGIFVGRAGTFRTTAAPDPNVSVQEPALNDGGTAAFVRSFDRAAQGFVTEIVTGNGGPLTTVVDTRGAFGSFGFRPPSLNNDGDVAFQAGLDDFSTSGVFVGPGATAARVVATGDTLDGATVQSLSFCEESLNDAGQLAFRASFRDTTAPFDTRVAIYRATPQR